MTKRKSERRFAPRLFARRVYIESIHSLADVRTAINLTMNNPAVFYQLEIDMDEDDVNRTAVNLTTYHRYPTSKRRGRRKAAAFADVELYHDYGTGKTVLDGAVFPHFFTYANLTGVLPILWFFSMLWCGLSASMIAGEGFVSDGGETSVLVTGVFFLFFTVVVVLMTWLGIVKPLLDQQRLVRRLRALAEL